MMRGVQPAEKLGERPSVGKYFFEIAVVFAVQFAAGKLADALPTISSGGVGPAWPASGVAVAALLLCGYRVWPGVAAGAFLLSCLSSVPPVAAAGYAAGSTLAALAAAFLLRRLASFSLSLSRLRDALALILLGAFGSSVISATIGVSVLYSVHLHGWSGPGRAWLIYWLGDSMGVLLVTPLVLTFPSLLRIRPRARIAEFATLLLLLTIASFIVFGDPLIPAKLDLLAFAVLPFVIWAAARFGVGGATLSTLLVATIATIETELGSGPFAQNTPFTNAVLLDVFFAVLSVSGLALAAVIAEREQSEREREQLVREQGAMQARLRLATIVESSDDAIIGADLDGMTTEWNKGAERLYGYSAGEVAGKPISLLVPSDHVGDLAEIITRTRQGDSVNHYETVHLKKDRTLIEVSMTVSPIVDADGRIVGVSTIARDITERKRADKTIRESDERFRLAAQAGKMFAYEWDAATDVIVRSAESAPILGIDETASITGQEVLAQVHTDDREKVKAAVAQLTPEKPRLQISYRIVRPDGGVIWVERNSRAHFDPQGRMLRIVGMVVDITERKRAETDLALAHEQLRLAMESAKVVGWDWNVTSGMNEWFGDLQSLFGISSNTYSGRVEDFHRRIHPQDRGLVAKAVAEAMQTKRPYAAEFRILWPDGSVHWASSKGRFYYSSAGEPERMLGMAVDITERRQAEESLRLFRTLIDESNDAIEVIDPKTLRFLDVNEKACHVLRLFSRRNAVLEGSRYRSYVR